MRTLILGAIASVWLGAAQAATPATAVLEVENMTCAACGLTIKTALQREPGVTSTEVDGDAGTVTVAFDAERITVDQVATAITEAGFPAKPRAAHDD
jgi:periplasmic mercuric ion binding protein